jgi:hypothetical protein
MPADLCTRRSKPDQTGDAALVNRRPRRRSRTQMHQTAGARRWSCPPGHDGRARSGRCATAPASPYATTTRTHHPRTTSDPHLSAASPVHPPHPNQRPNRKTAFLSPPLYPPRGSSRPRGYGGRRIGPTSRRAAISRLHWLTCEAPALHPAYVPPLMPPSLRSGVRHVGPFTRAASSLQGLTPLLNGVQIRGGRHRGYRDGNPPAQAPTASPSAGPMPGAPGGKLPR